MFLKLSVGLALFGLLLLTEIAVSWEAFGLLKFIKWQRPFQYYF